MLDKHGEKRNFIGNVDTAKVNHWYVVTALHTK